jgi:formylglycine-generating enzyme required for sulfatase activity
VSWHDAVAYCGWLAERTGKGYRLPTEAEWEYACRAGTQTRWSFGDDEAALATHAWYNRNADRRLHPVGTKEPNPWGLRDMHGNVWEWCADWYADATYAKRTAATGTNASGTGSESSNAAASASENPSGPNSGSSRVIRGGAWGSAAGHCCSAYRSHRRPSGRRDYLAFRLSRTV